MYGNPTTRGMSFAPRAAVKGLPRTVNGLGACLGAALGHPAARAVELTPRMWKTLFANDPLRSNLDLDRVPPMR